MSINQGAILKAYYSGPDAPEPRDDGGTLPQVDPADLLTADDWRDMARRFDGYARKAMTLRDGWRWMHTPDDAYWYARACYRFCLRFQLAGGKPDAA